MADESSSTDLALLSSADLAPMDSTTLKGEIGVLHDIAKNIMEDGVHFGVIEGVKKPSLFKAGAELLNARARLYADYEEISVIQEPKFIYYRFKCVLRHKGTDIKAGAGEGSCNGRKKYRYTYIDRPIVPVPKTYWAAKNKHDSKEMKRVLTLAGGNRATKVNNEWMVCMSEQVENDNPWDLDNTLLKMSQKRALVAATLNATAASEIFTQDVEDYTDQLPGTEEAPKEKPAGKKASGKKASKPADKQETGESTPGGALKSSYQTALALFGDLSYGKDSATNFIENVLAIEVPDDCTAPLSVLLNEEAMQKLIKELKAMKDAAGDSEDRPTPESEEVIEDGEVETNEILNSQAETQGELS